LGRQEQEEQGKAEQHLGRSRHRHVHPAPQESGEDPQQEADGHLHRRRRDADAERGAGPMHQAGEHVAPGAVCAERMLRRRRLRQRTLQLGELGDRIRPVPERRPERLIAGAEIGRREAAQALEVDQIGKEIEGSGPAQHDGTVAGDEIGEQADAQQRRCHSQSDEVARPPREPPRQSGPHGRFPLDEMRGSAAA